MKRINLKEVKKLISKGVKKEKKSSIGMSLWMTKLSNDITPPFLDLSKFTNEDGVINLLLSPSGKGKSHINKKNK